MRPSQEIQGDLTALERRIKEQFIQRTLKKTSLITMATPTQMRLHTKLWRECYEALKAEKKI